VIVLPYDCNKLPIALQIEARSPSDPFIPGDCFIYIQFGSGSGWGTIYDIPIKFVDNTFSFYSESDRNVLCGVSNYEVLSEALNTIARIKNDSQYQ
jgi:hypothetical protein